MTNSEKNEESAAHYNLNEFIQSAIQLTIPSDCVGMRLDQALAKLLPHFSRNRIQSWIIENRVILNQQPNVFELRLFWRRLKFHWYLYRVDAQSLREVLEIVVVHDVTKR